MRPPPRADRAGRVVVIGAGFGGLAVLAELARAGLQATLVDRHQYTTFQPLLYQVAAGGLNQGDVAFPVRSLLRRMRAGDFCRASLAEIDWPAHV
ncbi:MAG TPA: FAD-dependent oxidoreductase, partial [Candidatus Nanopelagicaceae bacterium]|nr:FAD-dependent oxidoreductase [Candidatus Nanopelagicaceae bacterium]